MKKVNLKVITIVGTRPEIIRLSRVTNMLDKYLDHKVIHTGQNYDYELNKIFYDQLKISKPNYLLNVDTISLGHVLGETIIKVEKILIKEKPDAILILGDTNASIAGIIAKRMKIPIYHMEAGNRSFDLNVPEEINRRIIDHIADYNLVYTENSRRHLISEGLHHRRIYLTGSPMYEVLKYNEEKIQESKILSHLKLNFRKYFLISFHREENVDNKDNFIKITNILNRIAEEFELPVIISMHPRTQKRLESLSEFKPNVLLKFCKPFGFFDYVFLQKNSLCTLSDSGTIAEESSILNFPAVTIRNSIERPEALDTGSIILTGLDSDIVLGSIRVTIEMFDSKEKNPIPKEYKISNTSERVLKLIIGTSKLSNKWWGIEIDN